MIIKHREMAGKVAKMFLVGDVKNKDVIIIDDMIDTAVFKKLSHLIKNIYFRAHYAKQSKNLKILELEKL